MKTILSAGTLAVLLGAHAKKRIRARKASE
jgi:hypothetical protein